MTSCPGAESCKLAVTQSRGLGKFLGDHLREHPELVAAAPDLQIKISGCPNGCGRHHIAGLGFQGSVRKVGGKAIPQYFVMVGGGPGRRCRAVRAACGEDSGPPADRGARAAARSLSDDRQTRASRRPRFSCASTSRASKQSCRISKQMTPATALADDFVDLAETASSTPRFKKASARRSLNPARLRASGREALPVAIHLILDRSNSQIVFYLWTRCTR